MIQRLTLFLLVLLALGISNSIQGQFSVQPNAAFVGYTGYSSYGPGVNLEYTIKKNQRRIYSKMYRSFGVGVNYAMPQKYDGTYTATGVARDNGPSINIPVNTKRSGLFVHAYWKDYLTECDLRTPHIWYFKVGVGYGITIDKNSLGEYNEEEYFPSFFTESNFRYGIIVPIGIGAEVNFKFGSFFYEGLIIAAQNRKDPEHSNTELGVGGEFRIGGKIFISNR